MRGEGRKMKQQVCFLAERASVGANVAVGEMVHWCFQM